MHVSWMFCKTLATIFAFLVCFLQGGISLYKVVYMKSCLSSAYKFTHYMNVHEFRKNGYSDG
jgi:hypothetical protein